jgi:subtilisin-like proprotein convertase family protein
MALTPLEVEVLNVDGSPASGATIELRHELTGVTADGYERDGSVMTPPILTDAAGAAMTWLPNDIYEWRSVGAVTSSWRAFRAYAGRGREGTVSSAPAQALPCADTITVASAGIDDAIGKLQVVVDFSHDHMRDAAMVLVPPYELVRVLTQLPVPAQDGVGYLEGAEVEVRNAVTGAAATLTDINGTPLGTPYLTVEGGLLSGYLPAGIYEWRVPTAVNMINTWIANSALSLSAPLWSGLEAILIPAGTDYAFDGEVTFTSPAVLEHVPIHEGDIMNVAELSVGAEGQAAVGDWTLWIAGAGTGTLREWSIEFVPI